VVRFYAWLSLAVTFTFLTGCAALDGFLLEGESGRSAVEGYSDLAAPFLGGYGGLAAGGVGLLSALYSAIRSRKWYNAGRSMVPAIDLVLARLESGDPVAREDVVKALQKAKEGLRAEREIEKLRQP